MWIIMIINNYNLNCHINSKGREIIFFLVVCGFVWWEVLGGDGLVTKSCPTLAISWTIACQAPLSMGFSRWEYWGGLPFPSPEDLSDPKIEPVSPALAGRFLTTEQLGKSYSVQWAAFNLPLPWFSQLENGDTNFSSFICFGKKNEITDAIKFFLI